MSFCPDWTFPTRTPSIYMAVCALPMPLRLMLLRPDMPPLSPMWRPVLCCRISEMVDELSERSVSVLETTTPLSAVIVTACSESETASSVPSYRPQDSRPAEMRIVSNIMIAFTEVCPRTPIVRLDHGRSSDLSPPVFYRLYSAPSHSFMLQWHRADVFRDLPLRAQFRSFTGFPYTMTPGCISFYFLYFFGNIELLAFA